MSVPMSSNGNTELKKTNLLKSKLTADRTNLLNWIIFENGTFGHKMALCPSFEVFEFYIVLILISISRLLEASRSTDSDIHDKLPSAGWEGAASADGLSWCIIYHICQLWFSCNMLLKLRSCALLSKQTHDIRGVKIWGTRSKYLFFEENCYTFLLIYVCWPNQPEGTKLKV